MTTPQVQEWKDGETIIRDMTPDEVAQMQKDAAEEQARLNAPPNSVTPMQAKFALAEQGHYQTVVDAINALPEPDRTKAKIAWESALDFKRDNPLVLMISQVLGWTETELDELFKLAATM